MASGPRGHRVLGTIVLAEFGAYVVVYLVWLATDAIKLIVMAFGAETGAVRVVN